MGTAVIVMLPEILKRVNGDVTNLIFGILLVAIMVFWQGKTANLWSWSRRRLSHGSGKTAPPEITGED